MSKFAGLGLAVDALFRMPILHPATGEPLADSEGTEAYIDLRAPDSVAVTAHDRATRQRRADRIARGADNSPEALEADGYKRFATMTAGWHLVTLDGERIDVECTTANARELYSARETKWITRQLADFIMKESNFAKASPES